ncbi:MAG: recombinase family protein [Streptosporangiaceae bacterium]
MSLAGYRLQGQPQQKVRAEHLDRAAVVYVRQSSRQQVLEHTESTRLQYALADRAVALGWARSQVTVIDDDLGVSAATADSRKGFARLVAEVTMGRVGIVLGIEMSRLARTGRDWHQLLELCCLSGVLLADPDGVYDPGYYNDRLLLGLKGTMSEAELYLIRQRMLSGKLAKAERGELAIALPIGYARRPSGEAILDPDEQAQHVVRLVFSAFRRLGTLSSVLRYLVSERVQLPVRVQSGPSKGELEWRRPTRETLQNLLHNPAYAGYYAYGRRQVDPRRKVPGRPDTGKVVKDSSEWLVLLPGRLPAYITPQEYEANVARMAANRQTAAAPGAPRDGAALLSGLLRCGRCGGHRMTVSYHDPGPARSGYGYTCAFYQVNYGTGGRCQHIAGAALDDYVAGQVLDAVAPAALEVSMAAAAQAEDERAMLDKLWRQRLERARYAADRARRQYQLAEPENRLVVRQLEADWEAALAEADRLEADYQRFTEELPKTLTAAERAAIQALARDLPAVWDAPSTTQADRKELLRILIEDITVNVAGDSELADVTITWAGGHQTSGQAVRPVARLDQLSYYPALLARVTGLAAVGRNNRQIADVLNAEGFRPPKRTTRFTGQQVRTLINQRGIRARAKGRPAALTGLAPGEWSVTSLWITPSLVETRFSPDALVWVAVVFHGTVV